MLMKFFLVLFLIFFIFYSFLGEVKITYTYKNGKKEEKTANFIQSLLVVFVFSILSSGFITLCVTAFYKFCNLIF